MGNIDASTYTSIANSAVVNARAEIEHPVHLSPGSALHAGSSVGAFTFVNFSTIIYANVTVGRFCSFARGCEIGVADHPVEFLSTHTFQYNPILFPQYPGYDFPRRVRHLAHRPTSIGSDVWIGAQAIVRSGVSIGHGAVIAANSVVTKDVPAYAIVAGSPAVLKRYRFSPDQVERLLSARWWDLPPSEIFGLPFDDIEQSLSRISQIRACQNAELSND